MASGQRRPAAAGVADRLAWAGDDLVAAAAVEGERELVRFELDQLDAALGSDSPASDTA